MLSCRKEETSQPLGPFPGKQKFKLTIESNFRKQQRKCLNEQFYLISKRKVENLNLKNQARRSIVGSLPRTLSASSRWFDVCLDDCNEKRDSRKFDHPA